MTHPSYKTDFYGWTQQQADLLRQGRVSEMDLDNLLEELEGMGRSEHRQMSHRLDVLLMHLLKWAYQPDHRSSSWIGSIKEQRYRLNRLIKSNPSLNPEIPEMMTEAYEAAQITAYKKTGLEDVFPTTCPWTFEQVMTEDFWPEH